MFHVCVRASLADFFLKLNRFGEKEIQRAVWTSSCSGIPLIVPRITLYFPSFRIWSFCAVVLTHLASKERVGQTITADRYVSFAVSPIPIGSRVSLLLRNWIPLLGKPVPAFARFLPLSLPRLRQHSAILLNTLLQIVWWLAYINVVYRTHLSYTYKKH